MYYKPELMLGRFPESEVLVIVSSYLTYAQKGL